jgi:hypothetical protein
MGADQWPWAPPSPPLLLAAALLVLLLALWRRLVWQPRAVARSFARQGIRGPPYSFLAGSLPEVKRLARASRRRVPHLDVGCHDIMPILLPPFHRWVVEYGNPNAPTYIFFGIFFLYSVLLLITSSKTYYGRYIYIDIVYIFFKKNTKYGVYLSA